MLDRTRRSGNTDKHKFEILLEARTNVSTSNEILTLVLSIVYPRRLCEIKVSYVIVANMYSTMH